MKLLMQQLRNSIKFMGLSLRYAKVGPCLAKNLLCFLACVTVGSLPDIAIKIEGANDPQKCLYKDISVSPLH